MMAYLSSIARTGVVASLMAITSLATEPSLAAPIGPIPSLALPESSKPLLVAMGEGRDHGPGYRVWRRGSNWNGGGRYWNGGGRYYGHRGWNRGWRGRYCCGGWGGWGSGFALGLGLGVPLGYWGGGYYGGYDPYYAAPIYRPRVYRRVGSAHVEWCYDRYRSYRAWDNTFQPYHGPRQQCYSPYR